MKFSFSMKNAKEFKSIFKLPSDYIDVFVSESLVVFFNSVVDVYTLSFYGIETKDDFDVSEQYTFRIPKKDFLNLMEDGVYTVLIAEDKVYIKLSAGSRNHSMRFTRQIANILLLQEMMEKTDKCTEYRNVKIEQLFMITKLSKTSRAPVSVENGYAFSSVDGMHVYSKVDCPDMSFFPISLNYFLSTIGDYRHVYDVQDCLVYSYENLGIIVRKAIGTNECDVEYINRQKALFSAEIDFASALSLISKIRNYTSVEINLNTKLISLTTEGNAVFEAQIGVKALNKEQSIEDLLTTFSMSDSAINRAPEIKFSAEVFKSILYIAKSKNLSLDVTKRNIRLRVGENLLLICPR